MERTLTKIINSNPMKTVFLNEIFIKILLKEEAEPMDDHCSKVQEVLSVLASNRPKDALIFLSQVASCCYRYQAFRLLEAAGALIWKNFALCECLQYLSHKVFNWLSKRHVLRCNLIAFDNDPYKKITFEERTEWLTKETPSISRMTHVIRAHYRHFWCSKPEFRRLEAIFTRLNEMMSSYQSRDEHHIRIAIHYLINMTTSEIFTTHLRNYNLYDLIIATVRLNIISGAECGNRDYWCTMLRTSEETRHIEFALCQLLINLRNLDSTSFDDMLRIITLEKNRLSSFVCRRFGPFGTTNPNPYMHKLGFKEWAQEHADAASRKFYSRFIPLAEHRKIFHKKPDGAERFHWHIHLLATERSTNEEHRGIEFQDKLRNYITQSLKILLESNAVKDYEKWILVYKMLQLSDTWSESHLNTTIVSKSDTKETEKRKSEFILRCDLDVSSLISLVAPAFITTLTANKRLRILFERLDEPILSRHCTEIFYFRAHWKCLDDTTRNRLYTEFKTMLETRRAVQEAVLYAPHGLHWREAQSRFNELRS